MKKELLYVLMTCCLIVFAACVDNIEDASSKHVYASDENPYLKTNTDANESIALEFSAGFVEEKTVDLSLFESKFQETMNMGLDQVLNGLANGTIAFHTISVSPTWSSWDKSPKTKGTEGWYFNSAGGICEEGDASQTASVTLNKSAKTLNISMNESVKAGTELYLNVGFAVEGPDYDTYLRFSIYLSVTDPTVVLKSFNIPEGDYNNYGIDFNDYGDVIQTIFGVSVTDFLANLDVNEGGTIRMYAVNINEEPEVWDVSSDYTANPPGYWLDADGGVISWGVEGFSLYAETNMADQLLYVGRAPALATGTTFRICIGFRDTTNENKYLKFILTATLD